MIPAATQLPPEFGLSETVGALPPKQAHAFVGDIRDKLTTCPDDDLGTDVEQLADEESGRRDLYVWRLTVEVSEDRSVRFLMAVIREGNAVAQLTFVPSGDVSIGADSFVTLAHRAQERLRELAPPRSATFPRGPGPTHVRRLVPLALAASGCSSPPAEPSARMPRLQRTLPSARATPTTSTPHRRQPAHSRVSRSTSGTPRRTATTTPPCVVTGKPADDRVQTCDESRPGIRDGHHRRDRRRVRRRGRVGPWAHAGPLPDRGRRHRAVDAAPTQSGRLARTRRLATTARPRDDDRRRRADGDQSVVWTRPAVLASDGEGCRHRPDRLRRGPGRPSRLLSYEYGEGNGSDESRANAIARATERMARSSRDACVLTRV